jgi:hypothetical protein
MAKSLFQKRIPEASPPTAYDLIESEIGHLKKGTSVRYGNKARTRTPPWVLVLGFCGLAWLYLMDPIYHAWYKWEAVRTYLYLHNYGSGSEAGVLAATQILSPDEVETLNHRTGSFQDYFSSPEAASLKAETIIRYMDDLKLLHAGKYRKLDPVGRMRYLLFIRTGILLPTDWTFLDPSVGD